MLNTDEIPKVPQSVEFVNQTVSVSSEPFSDRYLWRNILEYKEMDFQAKDDFNTAVNRYKDLKTRQQDEKQRLKVDDIMSEEHRQMENKVWARIAKTRGIDINKLVGEEYRPLKEVVKDEHRQ